MKKMLCMIMTMALAGSLLAGCGGSSQEAPSTTAAAKTEAQEKPEESGEAPTEEKADGEATTVFWPLSSLIPRQR